MPAHLRVSLPDRPGSLAAVTAALAGVGANVLSVSVADRQGGRAVDDLLLDWPHSRAADPLMRALDGCPGLRVHGLRHIAEPAVAHDCDLLGQVAAQPERAVETMIDAVPHLFFADWCALVDRRRPRTPEYATPGSPLPLPEAQLSSPRSRTMSADGETLLLSPMPDSLLWVLVGRRGGLGFTRNETQRSTSLLTVVAAVVRLAYRDASPRSPTATTARLLEPADAYHSRNRDPRNTDVARPTDGRDVCASVSLT